jgi:hypothetical protein
MYLKLIFLGCVLQLSMFAADINANEEGDIIICTRQIQRTIIKKNSSSCFTQKLASWFGKPNVKLEFDPGLKYWAKRWFWGGLQQNFFNSALQSNQSVPTPTNEKQEIVPWKTLGIPFGKIYTARNIPTQEKSVKKTVGSWLIYYLGKCLPLNTPGLPQIPEDTEDLMTLSYPQEFRQLFPAPQCPLQIINKDDLIGALALAGPFA